MIHDIPDWPQHPGFVRVSNASVDRMFYNLAAIAPMRMYVKGFTYVVPVTRIATISYHIGVFPAKLVLPYTKLAVMISTEEGFLVSLATEETRTETEHAIMRDGHFVRIGTPWQCWTRGERATKMRYYRFSKISDWLHKHFAENGIAQYNECHDPEPF